MATMKRLMLALVCASFASTLGACKLLEQLKKSGEAATQLDGSAAQSSAAPSSQEDKDAELGELEKLTKTAHAYYDQKDYKDDKFAQGMAMHRPLMAAFAAFEKADKPFEDQVGALNDAINQRRLVRLRNDPSRRLEYDIAKSVDDAKKLVHFAEVNSLDKLDATGLGGALTDYERSYGELTSYSDGHAAEADKVMLFSSFKSAAADFLKSAKELMRRKRDNKGFKGEILPPELIDGHPAQVISKYDDLINASNNLRYR
jgi:hypothetical protein